MRGGDSIRKMTNARITKGGMKMLKLNKLRRDRHLNPMPMPVNLNDCLLLYQMGYAVIIHDGKVVAVVK